MANEAVLREKPTFYFPCDFTVADGTAITKGALLQVSDPRTASAVTASGAIFAGIAARDKIASDGLTQLAVYQSGIFDIYLSGGASAGQFVGSAAGAGAYPNHVRVVNSGAAEVSGSAILGYTLQAGVNNDQVQVRLLLA